VERCTELEDARRIRDLKRKLWPIEQRIIEEEAILREEAMLRELHARAGAAGLPRPERPL